MLAKRFNGVVLWPFLVVRSKSSTKDQVFMNHERIHFKQQQELLIIPFYLWYLIEFLVRLVRHKSFDTAYRMISFEREAYAQECNLDYLSKRKFWNFVTYL